jgi:hypothetical protein
VSKRAEYLANAKECERLAKSFHNHEERAAWLQMAQQWLRWAKDTPIGLTTGRDRVPARRIRRDFGAHWAESREIRDPHALLKP